MQIGFKFKYCQGFGRLYNYGLKHNPNYMIAKTAEERLKIIRFWKKHGLPAACEAYNVKRSTLFNWQKTYRENGRKPESLVPGSQAPLTRRKRIIDPRLLGEIKRLRLEVCPNLGKDKVKVFLDEFCRQNNLKTISVSTIGRIIKEKKIYHHRQKVTHFGKLKVARRAKKLRKPASFQAKNFGELVELDTVVRFDWNIKRYIITAVDTYSRYAFSWSYRHANSQNAKDFFQKLETVFPYQIKHIQTDNGSEFHKYFKDYLKEQKITHYWNYPGKPYKNGHVEKYNRTVQDEFIDQNSAFLEDSDIFNRKLMDYLVWYNTRRPHWSLNLVSPVDFMLKNNCESKMMWTKHSTIYCTKFGTKNLKKINFQTFRQPPHLANNNLIVFLAGYLTAPLFRKSLLLLP